jgi:hypothetical protein
MEQEIENKILARWKDMREQEKLRHQNALDKIDIDWETTLENFRSQVKTTPELLPYYEKALR